MKKLFTLINALFSVLFFSACSNQQTTEDTTATADSTANVTDDWKLGVAFWTYHTFPLPEVIAKIDSSGVDYMEGASSFKAGEAFNDSMMYELSPAGVNKLKEMFQDHDLTMQSLYIGGDETVASWKQQFELAKNLGVKFVTGEPPVSMWDAVDSLAGAYGMKLAIHEHWKGVSPYWHPDSVLAAIEGHPNFGACADLGHWPKSGVVPLEAVKKLDGHIIGVHLKDIAAYDDPKLKDVPIGTGVVDIPAILAELKRQGFTGPIYIERDAEDQPSNLPSVIKSVEYYNEQVSKLK